MSLREQFGKVKAELLPGYPDIFKTMFDSVSLEGLPVEAEEVSDEVDSGDELDDDEFSSDEELPAVHGVPCNSCAPFVDTEPTTASVHHLKLQQMLVSN